jgi:large subunit ribosomal protein L21
MSFVVESGSNQFLVSHNQKIIVDQLVGEVGTKVSLPVIFDTDGKLKVIDATIVEHKKSDKIRVVKYKAKSNYHKQYGHRSYQTVLEIM